MSKKVYLGDSITPYWKLQEKYKTESGIGEIRDEMSSWWLSLIETRALENLCKVGYAKDGLPYNYLDVPPKSLQTVRNNKKIINEILKSGEQHLREVIVDPIRKEVYERVDGFVEQGETFLRIEKAKGESETKYTHLERYIKDLKDMKSDENSAFSGKGSRLSGSKGVVPINGLIVGYLYRLDYELSTAIDHWSKRI